MKHINRFLTLTFLMVMSVLFLMTFTILAKELPLLVDISELSEEYDGKRIVVMGWARSAVSMRGRMGSQFVKTEIGEGDNSVTVYSDFPPYNVVNNRVIVQGVYHRSGRFGGYSADHFIVADTLLREWG
ncbi:MAG: hypothetical protein ACE5GK_04915 [Nitrospiria bacterium]